MNTKDRIITPCTRADMMFGELAHASQRVCSASKEQRRRFKQLALDVVSMIESGEWAELARFIGNRQGIDDALKLVSEIEGARIAILCAHERSHPTQSHEDRAS